MLIDQLPTLAEPTNTDELPIERGTTTYKASLLNLLLSVVKKAGDTMTGNLIIYKDVPMLILKDPILDITATSFSVNRYQGVHAWDKNNKEAGYLQWVTRTSNVSETDLVACRTVNGAQVTNQITLTVDQNGNGGVWLSHPAAWRSAVGLATPTQISTIADIITAASGITITAANYAVYGKVAQLCVKFKRSTALVNPGSFQIGVLANGKKPAITTGVSGSAINGGEINSAGTVTGYGSVTANTEYTITATYILP